MHSKLVQHTLLLLADIIMADIANITVWSAVSMTSTIYVCCLGFVACTVTVATQQFSPAVGAKHGGHIANMRLRFMYLLYADQPETDIKHTHYSPGGTKSPGRACAMPLTSIGICTIDLRGCCILACAFHVPGQGPPPVSNAPLVEVVSSTGPPSR